MKYVYSYWFKFSEEIHNIGDDLGPYIINRLSGLKVKYVYVNDVTYKNFIRRFLRIVRRSLFVNDFRFIELKTYFISLFLIRKYIISVGSIIQHAATEKAIVWGSGINYPDKKIKKAEFRAVRGPLTIKVLREYGIDTNGIVLGDPALLLPLIYKPISDKKYNLGIISHLAHESFVRGHCTNKEILIISMKDDNIEKILNQINQCKVTISSSLHGIIISHAYNIPSLWFKFPGYIGGEKDIKFSDYFMSVGIIPYDGYEVDYNYFDNMNFFVDKILLSKTQSLPQCDIAKIQSNLLKAAPFKLLEKYESILCNLKYDFLW